MGACLLERLGGLGVSVWAGFEGAGFSRAGSLAAFAEEALFLDCLEMAAWAFARSPKEMDERSSVGFFPPCSSSVCAN